MPLEIQVLAWDRHKYVAELSQLIGSDLSPLDIWIYGIVTAASD